MGWFSDSAPRRSPATRSNSSSKYVPGPRRNSVQHDSAYSDYQNYGPYKHYPQTSSSGVGHKPVQPSHDDWYYRHGNTANTSRKSGSSRRRRSSAPPHHVTMAHWAEKIDNRTDQLSHSADTLIRQLDCAMRSVSLFRGIESHLTDVGNQAETILSRYNGLDFNAERTLRNLITFCNDATEDMRYMEKEVSGQQVHPKVWGMQANRFPTISNSFHLGLRGLQDYVPVCPEQKQACSEMTEAINGINMIKGNRMIIPNFWSTAASFSEQLQSLSEDHKSLNEIIFR